MSGDRRTDLQLVKDEVINSLGGKLTILACCFFVVSVFLAIISLQCLYADGSALFTHVLEQEDVVAWARSRYCANLVFQLPLLTALKLGCTNLHLLQLAYGAGCFLPWVVSMALCYYMAPQHFWLVMLGCAFGHLNAAFLSVGECIIAHAFFWPVLFAVLFVRPLTLVAAIIMVNSSLVLLFSYESLLFLGPLLGFLALARIFNVGEKNWSRVAFGLSFVLLISAALIALNSVLHPQDPQNFSGFRTGLRSTLRIPTWTTGWSFIWLFLMGVVCVRGKRFTEPRFKLVISLMVAAIIVWGTWPLVAPTRLHVWRQYDCRPLQLMVPLALLIVAWAMTRKPGWFEWRRPYLVAFSASWLLAQSLWHISTTWQWNEFVGTFRGVLAAQKGPIYLHDTALNRPPVEGHVLTFDWDWAMPSLSIMLAPGGRVRSIMLPESKHSYGLNALDLSQLPPLQKFGVNYSDYVKAAPKREISDYGIHMTQEQLIKFYQQKAEAGEGAAQIRLGEIYVHGVGAETNAGLARKWLSAALTNGYPQAVNLLSHIEPDRAESK
jgi:hypothetical protein